MRQDKLLRLIALRVKRGEATVVDHAVFDNDLGDLMLGYGECIRVAQLSQLTEAEICGVDDGP